MRKIQSISQLVRLPNVLIVVLTMYLMRWSIVKPILYLLGFDPAMPEWSFALLVLSTALITAAGNVINDFHDIKADRVNNPGRVVIDRFVSRRQAILSHIVLNTLGVIIGIFVIFYHWIPWLVLVYLLVPAFLWLYSLSLKHQPLIGNLMVSILTAMVPLLVLLFEYPLLVEEHATVITQDPNIFKPIIYWIGLFSLFAFLTNLIRELIKDGQDVEGDSEIGSKTLAIVLGLQRLKALVFVLAAVTLIFLGIIFMMFLRDQISLVFFTVFLLIPFILLGWKVLHVKSPSDWKPISFLAKLVMLFGLLYAPVAFLLFDSLAKII